MIHARKDYNRIQDPENLIGQDEPVFLLRAKDMCAPDAIYAWCAAAEINGVDQKMIQAAWDHAGSMLKWQESNGNKIPDMPEQH